MSNSSHLRIATRQSPLALRQAEIVKNKISQLFPSLKVQLIPFLTAGDKELNKTLSSLEGKGMFIKELEEAIIEDKADIAVHSLKDMPAQVAPGLSISTFIERDDPRDVLISPKFAHLDELLPQAKVGTASLRRHAMLKHERPDIIVEMLRGNVNTRLKRCEAGDFDAIILAAAGLHRLGLSHIIRYYFSPEESLPAVGQGIICIESRIQDKTIQKILKPLDHYPTRLCAQAERAMNKALGGNCHAPIAGYATISNGFLYLRGRVFSPDGAYRLFAEMKENMFEAEKIGRKVGELLIEQGANKLLESIKIS